MSHLDTDKRHDFFYLFDVKDGNPNGDPDAGNLPRIDPETMQGLVSDVCLKRKVRNWISLTQEDEKIYVEEQGILYNQQEKAYQALDFESDANDRSSHEKAREWMCENFYDVRMFGAVMSTSEFNCGQVQGPLQLTFARSIDAVVPQDLTITRVAVTKPEDARSQTQEDIAEGESGSNKMTEMGRKQLIPYGLYACKGFYNPYLAEDTGVKSEDLKLFWESLQTMWDFDRSSSKGMMACRGLYIFSHEKKTGNAPAHKLFNKINIKKKDNVEVPRSINDYDIELKEDEITDGIKLTKLY